MKSIKKNITISIVIVSLVFALLLSGGLLLLNNSNTPPQTTQNTANASETSTTATYTYTGCSGYNYAVIYVYYDNTYIQSCSIDLPYIYNVYASYQPTFGWDGGFRLNLKSGYEWTSTAFTARFVWSIGDDNYNETYYGTRLYSEYYNTNQTTAKNNALNQANSILSSGGTYAQYVNTLTYSRSGNGFSTSSDINKCVLICASSSRYYSYLVGVLKITIDSSMVQPITYTLRFDYNGGVGDVESTQVKFNDTIGLLPTATKAPYTLSGWTINGSTVTQSTKWTYSKDMVAVAQWTFSGYTLTSSVDSGGGGYITGANTQYQNNDVVTATAVPYSGYKFLKWVYNGNEVSVNPISFNIKQNSTLVAYFTTASNVSASILEGSGTITHSVENGVTSIMVTPTSDEVYKVMIDGIEVPIEYYMANIWNTGSASSITYFAKDSTNVFLIQFEYIYQPITLSIYIGARTDLKEPVLGSGGTNIDKLAVYANSGGEARITGIDEANESTVVHLSAVAYTGYYFAGWVANDGTDLSAYKSTDDIPYNLIQGKIITANFLPNANNGTVNGAVSDSNSDIL